MQIAQPSIALPTCKYEIFTHIIHLSIYGTSKISSSAFFSNTHTPSSIDFAFFLQIKISKTLGDIKC
jgi:hypothetical protein